MIDAVLALPTQAVIALVVLPLLNLGLLVWAWRNEQQMKKQQASTRAGMTALRPPLPYRSHRKGSHS